MEELFDKVAFMTNPTRQQIDAAIHALFTKLKEQQVDQLTLPRDMTSEDWRELVFQLKDDYQKTKNEHLVRGFDVPAVIPAIAVRRKDATVTTEDERLNALMAEHNLTPLTRECPDYPYALTALREANEELARLKLAKVRGDELKELVPQGRFSPSQLLNLSSTGRHRDTVSPDIGIVMEELIEQKVRTGFWRDKTLVEYQPKLRKFVEFLKAAHGHNHVKINQVTYGDLVDFQNHLKTSTPNKAQAGTTYSVESIRKHFSAIKMLMEYALQRHYIDRSPYQAGLFNEKARPGDKENYRSFTSEELKKLFGSAQFNDRRHFKQTSHWWMPVLGLFTGARQGELVLLTVDDVQHENGTDYLMVTSTDEHDIKNKWSKRKIPLHPTLVELGFLDFVAQHRKRKGKHLFPDLKKNPRGEGIRNPQATYSRRFARLLDKLDMKDPLLVYHSFRHTFITYMRQATPRVSTDDIMAMTGHIGDDVHSKYGERPPVWILAPEMAKLDYGLDWKELLKPQDKPKATRKRTKSPYRKNHRPT